MIESVENYLSAHGYNLIIANTKENPEREETNIRLLSAGLVDGLLVASTMDDFQRFDALIPAGFPGLLVAEKSVSVTNLVNGSTRLQPVVLQIGQATGALAALAAAAGGDPSEVAVRRVQEAVLDAGGYLLT